MANLRKMFLFSALVSANAIALPALVISYPGPNLVRLDRSDESCLGPGFDRAWLSDAGKVTLHGPKARSAGKVLRTSKAADGEPCRVQAEVEASKKGTWRFASQGTEWRYPAKEWRATSAEDLLKWPLPARRAMSRLWNRSPASAADLEAALWQLPQGSLVSVKARGESRVGWIRRGRIEASANECAPGGSIAAVAEGARKKEWVAAFVGTETRWCKWDGAKFVAP